MPTNSTVNISELTFREALSLLKQKGDLLPWPQRRDLVHLLRDAFAAGTANQDAVALVHFLVADPKWEVRAALADILPFVPTGVFDRIAAQFAADTNNYVRGSFERASGRRTKDDRAIGKTRRSADQVSQHLRAIESSHGKPAATKALRLAERYCELLVGSMIHDIRSILTHLTCNCRTLMREANSTAKAKRTINQVRNDLNFLESTIKDMGIFAQPIPLERRPERLAAVVADAFGMACENLRKSKFDPDSVEVDFQVPQSIVVEMARHQIVIAVANVVTNAFESFAVGTELRAGRIEIAAALVGDRVRIVTRDNGQGMSEEEIHAPLLLTPGRRNKSKRESTGYGLPIVARNLAAHGGTVEFESQEHVGTTVTLTLPLVSR
ncbi:sensor histidine kinase [Anatilimnocola sp. NA78]|uniref:sensor histidine kinase n=1 Tax=Anatilimnocola sp. NA78 TaxID=3415683 RepID=UPI003CE57741